MTQPERWYERVIEHLRRREAVAAERKRLALSRRIAKEIRHQERLRKQVSK